MPGLSSYQNQLCGGRVGLSGEATQQKQTKVSVSFLSVLLATFISAALMTLPLTSRQSVSAATLCSTYLQMDFCT